MFDDTKNATCVCTDCGSVVEEYVHSYSGENMDYSLSLHQNEIAPQIQKTTAEGCLRYIVKRMCVVEEDVQYLVNGLLKIVNEWILFYQKNEETISSMDIVSICCASFIFNEDVREGASGRPINDQLVHHLCEKMKNKTTFRKVCAILTEMRRINNRPVSPDKLKYTADHSEDQQEHKGDMNRKETSKMYSYHWIASIDNEIKKIVVNFESSQIQRFKMKGECNRVVMSNSDAILYSPKYIATCIVMKELQIDIISTKTCKIIGISRSKLRNIKNSLYNF
jgi:hypothetical protein